MDDLYNTSHVCACIGPQNGEPRCPCVMRGVVQRNGRWVKPEQDLGPVRKGIDEVFHDTIVDWSTDDG